METSPQAKAPTTQEKFNTVRSLMEQSKGQMQAAAPYLMNLDRSIRMALTTFQKTPKLLDCHPATLLGALIQLTQLGLELDSATNQAHLVPFYNSKKSRFDATLIIGYKGLEKMAINAGQIKRIMPRVVHDGDAFQYSYGLVPTLNHIPMDKSSAMTHVYAVAYLADGGVEFAVMTKEEVDKIRARSKAANAGPWVTDYEEMSMKTVTRRICKRLPNTTTQTAPLHKAISLDEKAEINEAQDLGMVADPENETPTEADPPAAPKVDNPLPEKSSSEKPLAKRWAELQGIALEQGVDLKKVLVDMKIKEVKNDNIEQIELKVADLAKEIGITTTPAK